MMHDEVGTVLESSCFSKLDRLFRSKGEAGSGDCQIYPTENIRVEEGERLALRCLVPRDADAALQWLTPLGFVAFFNNQKVLKDRRYELVRYSENELSISLSNVTVWDEGLYTCIHYTYPIQSKKVHVTVLAPPSEPLLKASVHDDEGMMTLTCSTWGSKPPPKMTWLLENGIEVYGKMEYKFDRGGKKCQTSSALVIGAYLTDTLVKCVVRHESLKPGALTTAFRLTSFSITDMVTDVPGLGTVTSHNPQNHSESEQAVTTQLSTEKPATSDSPAISTQGRMEESSLIVWTGTLLDPEETALTVENSTVTGTLLAPDETTFAVKNATAIKNHYGRTGQRKSGVLLIILVVFLIVTLLIIVQLFMRKLRKAHLIWKKETNVSDQTTESNKSRSNEDNPCQDRNEQFPNQKPIPYVNEVFSVIIPRCSKETTDPVAPDPDETIV
ncbi:cytotoxic and regulatory T-cell molecule [Rhinatrema bivittatum]|uniref:cytotoxic and regulatory T-cell molecule n=1 Tax=Rhinatrema bivittatum TaxID=194408 RepID=UPI00112CE5AF|nr:cytotoxic and regulatory T-cell molecule [Rhinatrema bivittatum]